MIDLTKDRKMLKKLYQPGTKEFVLVDVPTLPFAFVEGQGSPDIAGPKAIKCLFQAIYRIRRQARERMGKSFVEPPVEMLYWADDMGDLMKGNKDKWQWRAMVPLPIWVNEKALAQSISETEEMIGALEFAIKYEQFTEGKCVQIMHKGLVDEIPTLLKRLFDEFLPARSLKPRGAYHEIYLDDWSRVAPKKRKMILRQPLADSGFCAETKKGL